MNVGNGFRFVKPKGWLSLALGKHALGFRDCLGGVQTLGASIRAIHDRVTAIQAEGVLQIVQTFPGCFVAAVGQPALGLQQNGGT